MHETHIFDTHVMLAIQPSIAIQFHACIYIFLANQGLVALLPKQLSVGVIQHPFSGLVDLAGELLHTT